MRILNPVKSNDAKIESDKPVNLSSSSEEKRKPKKFKKKEPWWVLKKRKALENKMDGLAV